MKALLTQNICSEICCDKYKGNTCSQVTFKIPLLRNGASFN